ncbi:MAG: CDP-alcohol phosphatidyltransferase family protein [Saprospiraceae bacterium]
MKIPLNIPNILSLYRLLSFPFVFYLAWTGQERLFVWFLCINLVTDILDGLIARVFNMMTEIGAKLDSLADLGTYILAFLGIFLFKSADFQPHLFSFCTFIGLFVLCYLFSLIKFGRFPSLHLYSWKIGGYIQGFFFFALFVFGFSKAFYYIMVTWGIAAFLEHLIIQIIIPEMRSNAKGLYWILRR